MDVAHSNVISRMQQLVEDYDKYNVGIYGKHSPCNTKSPKTWLAPPNGCIKVNCDASLATDGWIGIGVVARNHLGKVLFASSRRMKGR